MRTIKFRAKFGNDEKWYYFTLGDLVCSSTLTSEFLDGEFHDWCEFTGLLDKNGKEIYEGDIVKNINTVQWIDWREDMACFVSRQKIGASMQINFDDDPWEVIGNVWENSDLLK